jgi:hypothetical protein
MKSSTVWDITPYSPLKALAYSSTLKMEAICSTETLADFQRTTRRYIPEDRTSYPLLWEPQILRN